LEKVTLIADIRNKWRFALLILVGRKRHADQYYMPYGDFTTTPCQGAMRVIAFIEDQEVIPRSLPILGCGRSRPGPGQ
jgi:hypothetical protein